jgi:hypothetical protein
MSDPVSYPDPKITRLYEQQVQLNTRELIFRNTEQIRREHVITSAALCMLLPVMLRIRNILMWIHIRVRIRILHFLSPNRKKLQLFFNVKIVKAAFEIFIVLFKSTF